MGLFGSSVKQSSARAESQSGLGDFAPINNVNIGFKLIDYKDPIQLAMLAVLGVIGYYAYRKGYKWIG